MVPFPAMVKGKQAPETDDEEAAADELEGTILEAEEDVGAEEEDVMASDDEEGGPVEEEMPVLPTEETIELDASDDAISDELRDDLLEGMAPSRGGMMATSAAHASAVSTSS